MTGGFSIFGSKKLTLLNVYLCTQLGHCQKGQSYEAQFVNKYMFRVYRFPTLLKPEKEISYNL